jgi:hypothetical protein
VHGTVVVGRDVEGAAPPDPFVVDALGVPFPALPSPPLAPAPAADRPDGQAHGLPSGVLPGVPPPPVSPLPVVPPAATVVDPCDALKLLSEQAAPRSSAQTSATIDPRPSTATTVDARVPSPGPVAPIVQPRFSEHVRTAAGSLAHGAVTMRAVALTWTFEELLATDPVVEPLLAGGRRCHGGYDADGRYVSPRTCFRTPAIRAWQEAHVAAGGTLLEAPIDEWPAAYPNIAQSRFLLEAGVRVPMTTTLTRIGTVEGFGGLIRTVLVPELARHFADPIDGTALAHLGAGLFEAHARDETGHGEEAGHKEMWFVARDIALGSPSDDDLARLYARMGINPGATPARAPAAEPLHAELEPEFEAMLRFMIGLLFIEVSAFHTFAWAEALLGDATLVDGDGRAAELVRCIRADETPHVEYLRTALSEARDRTLVGRSGRPVEGRAVIDRLWAVAKADSMGPRRELFRAATLGEIDHALEGRGDADDIRAEFHSLATAA